MALAPAAAAPITMLMEAISLSPWIKMPSFTLRRCSDMYSVSSFWGVMG
jgi:hypothetical protein